MTKAGSVRSTNFLGKFRLFVSKTYKVKVYLKQFLVKVLPLFGLKNTIEKLALKWPEFKFHWTALKKHLEKEFQFIGELK